MSDAAIFTALLVAMMGTEEGVRTPAEYEGNLAAYEREADSLRREHRGRWVAIAAGKVLAPFDSLEAASAAADRAAPEARHRFIYRPDDDEVTTVFRMSAWSPLPGDPGNWLQVGIGWLNRRGVTFMQSPPRVTLQRDELEVHWPLRDVSRGRLEIAPPAGGEARDEEYVFSGMMGYALTVTEDLVAALGLDRFGVPGIVRFEGMGGPSWDFRRVRCRVRIPALDLDEMAAAIVVRGPDREWKPAADLDRVTLVRFDDGRKRIDDYAAVKELVRALLASLDPIEPALPWEEGATKPIDFVIARETRVELALREGERFSMRLPGLAGSRDYRISPELDAALRKHGLR